MPLQPTDTEGLEIWLPPGSITRHLITCAKCGDSIEMGKVIFWELGDEKPIPFDRPCAEWFRENQWWRPEYRKRATKVLEEITHLAKHRGKWTQAEIDSKAEQYGLEQSRKFYRGGTPGADSQR